MSTQSRSSDPTSFILRTVDGAAHPVVVEKVYALWMGNVVHLHDGGRVRDPFFVRWPTPGAAWEAFQGPIRELIEAGSLVMCSNVDSADHPEYHLTQGNDQHKPFFAHGPKPMVLRYLATPAGSIAWRNTLNERKQKKRRSGGSAGGEASAVARVRACPDKDQAIHRRSACKRALCPPE